MRRSISFAAAIAVTTLNGTASLAQTFEPRVAFRFDHSLNAMPNAIGFPELGYPGRYNFNALFGAFNAQGFTNRGMFNFIGTMTLYDSEPNGTTLAPRQPSPLFSPYSFGNVFDNPNPTTITFDANRGTGQVDNIPWNFGDPAPAEVFTYPAFGAGNLGGAPDTYHPGLRFHLDVAIVWDPERLRWIEINGTMQAISDWFVVAEQAPEPGVPGFQSLLPAGFVEMPVNVIFGNIPTPATAGTLGLGALLAARRRRV